MQWPWKRFEAFYEAFVKRHLVETLERRKENMINGFWSNEGMNDDKGTRQNAIQELETNFTNAINKIMFGGGGVEGQEEIDKSDPFFSAMKDIPKLEDPSADLSTVGDVVEGQQDLDYDIDQ